MSNRSMKFNIHLSEFPEHALLVANMIALWSTVERACGNIMGTLVGPDPWQSNMLLGAVQTSSARIDFIKAAGETTLMGPLLAEFRTVMSAVDACLAKRNKYAHGTYAKDHKDRLCILNPKFDWLESQKGGRPLSIAELKECWDTFTQTYNAVIKFHNDLHSALPNDYMQASQKTQLLRKALGQPNPANGAPHSATTPQDPPQSSLE